jgi:2-iminoacetate synthase
VIAMSFVEAFHRLPWDDWMDAAMTARREDVLGLVRDGARGLGDFARLLSPVAQERGVLEGLCQRSQAITQQRFGKVIRLFAPLYLSNECVNNCAYCGFSRDNPIFRVTLSVDDVRREARALAEQGFRNILLVAGEHPKFVSGGYVEECVRMLHSFIPSLSLELGPMETPDYVPLARAGAEGLVVYQETYEPEVYTRLHTAGPKRDFDWRLACPERAYAAGFRRLGIGALHGLADWRREALAVAAHAQYLLRHCWKAQVTISIPRLRPCAGEFQPLTHLGDRELVQLVAAFRLFLPDVGLVLSTREPAPLRDGLFRIGFTHASAGSHTEPGGYTGAGMENLHQTVRGRAVAPGTVPFTDTSVLQGKRTTQATGQFAIADERSPAEIADLLRRLGYEPVWKDWDAALTA